MPATVRRVVPVLAALSLIGVAASPAAADFVKWSSANKGLDLGSGQGVIEVTLGGQPPVAYAIVDGAGMYRSPDLGDS